MNKNTILFWCLIILINTTLSAQVQTPFTERFSRSIEGGVTIIANNMLSRDSIDPYNGEDDNHNERSVFVDIDNDPTTFNSSNANFKNPEVTEPCKVLRAFLYWAAATDGSSVPGWDFNEVKLMLPGETEYTTITADDVIYDGTDGQLSNRPYVCFKDLTPNVVDLGQDIYGLYQVANVEAEEGSLGRTGTSGGWQIVFIYESPELSAKNITLFDGYGHIQGDRNNPAEVDIDFGGFVTIPTGIVGGDVVFGALEGDRSLEGDNLLIKDVGGHFVDLIAPLRPNNNYFNSRITLGNNDYLNRTPASTNTLGFDAAVFELDNPGNSILNNASTATTLRITSNSEVYGLYLLGLAVEVYKPNLDPMLITQISGSTTPNHGDTIGFNFNIQNRGNDDTLNLTLTSTLPQQVVYVPNPLPVGVTYTYDEDINELIFQVEDGLMDIGDPALGVNIEFQIKEECFFLEDDCDLEFEIEFEASFNGAINPDDPLISISTVDPSTCLDTPVIINIKQPVVSWATAPTSLDRTLSCGDVAGITAAQTLFPVPNKCTFIINKTTGPLIPDPNCPSAESYENTWNFTDACGVTIADYVQTIRVEDNEQPTATNPPTINLQCMADVPDQNPEVVTDEVDNCSIPTVELASQNIDGTTCPIVITRIYRVTDFCGKFTEVKQIINVNDNIAPELVSPLEDATIICAEIPEVPTLEFIDNCTPNVMVNFSETTRPINDITDEIIRTWIATDECGNESTFTQTITIEMNSVSDVQGTTLCIEDEEIDMNTFVTNTNVLTGMWSTNTTDALNGSVFNPIDSSLGNHEFIYEYIDGDCSYKTTVNIVVHGDCIRCEKTMTNAINISKLVTPNDDGVNDFLVINYDIKNPNARLCAFTISLDIFNRWGTRVYSNTNYDNTWKGESPVSSIGTSDTLPAATYYYIVKFNDTAEEIDPIQGYIMLGATN